MGVIIERAPGWITRIQSRFERLIIASEPETPQRTQKEPRIVWLVTQRF